MPPERLQTACDSCTIDVLAAARFPADHRFLAVCEPSGRASMVDFRSKIGSEFRLSLPVDF